MQLLSLEPCPLKNATVVCRQSRLVSVAAAAVFVVLLAGIPAAMWIWGHLPTIAVFGISVIAAIVLPIVGGDTYAAFLRSNWVFAYGPGGIWINFRSYKNHRLEPANTVVHLSFDEVDFARRETVVMSEDMGDGTMTWKEVSLCLQLGDVHGDQLKQAIDVDRKRRSTTSLLGGLITTYGRSNHAPVRVSTNRVARIMWRSRYDVVRPGLGKVLDGLSKYVQVQAVQPGNSDRDCPLSDKQIDDRILGLVEAGETLAAVKLLKLRKGYSVTEAKRFVDELTGQLST